MAASAPVGLSLEENLPIHRGHAGKRADGPKAKPFGKPGLQEKKPLQDVSNAGKPPVSVRKPLRDVSNAGKLPESNILKGAALKATSLRRHGATKNPVKKTVIFDDETAKCHEWAKDGLEGAQFTGNDSLKLEKDRQDKRVKKKVEKIMSALHGWSDVVFDPVVFPAKVDASLFEEEEKYLELEPEMPLPEINRRPSSSGGDKLNLAEDSSFEAELDDYPFLEYRPIEFQLRDE